MEYETPQTFLQNSGAWTEISDENPWSNPSSWRFKIYSSQNLVDLGGLPLIQWTIQAALGSNLTRVVVSTDDDEISDFSRSLGAEVPFKRPAELSSDITLSIDVVLHALDVIEEEFDAVMMLQPTSPFRTSTDIENAMKIIDGASSVISVVPVEEHIRLG